MHTKYHLIISFDRNSSFFYLDIHFLLISIWYASFDPEYSTDFAWKLKKNSIPVQFELKKKCVWHDAHKLCVESGLKQPAAFNNIYLNPFHHNIQSEKKLQNCWNEISSDTHPCIVYPINMAWRWLHCTLCTWNCFAYVIIICT